MPTPASANSRAATSPLRAQQQGGFLDFMRDACRRIAPAQLGADGRQATPRWACRAGLWRAGRRLIRADAFALWRSRLQPPPASGSGGSFLGTAAAAAAGVIGGSC